MSDFKAALNEVEFQNRHGDPHVVVKVTYWQEGEPEYYASKIAYARKANFIEPGFGGTFEIIR